MGVSMAMGLAEAGADICLLQRNVEDVHVRDSIRALGRRAEIIHFDASDQASVRTVVDRILQVFPTLDILVNNAGIALRHDAVDFPEEDFDQVIQVNVKSVWTMCQAAARHMIPKGQGKIINTASVLSYQGGYRVPPYSASKSAVASLTKPWPMNGQSMVSM